MLNTHKSSPKRKTEHVTLWLKPEIKAELKRLAELNGLSVSQTGGAFLEKALLQNLHERHAALLQPMIKQAIREELRAFGNRLLFFLMRIAFAGEQTRILVTNVLDRILKREAVEAGVFTSLVDQSNRMARRNIIHNTPQIKSLLQEWEGLLKDEGREADGKTSTGQWQS